MLYWTCRDAKLVLKTALIPITFKVMFMSDELELLVFTVAISLFFVFIPLIPAHSCYTVLFSKMDIPVKILWL